jgi:DNA processing protein
VPADIREINDPEARARHLEYLESGGFPRGGLESQIPLIPPDPDLIKSRMAEDLDLMHRLDLRYWLPDGSSMAIRLGTDAPRLLFTSGTPDQTVPSVAVVGTRRPDAYGLVMARELGRSLGRSGVTVVSGGAIGIDGAAHEGALEAGGRTLVVLGGGLADPHPPANRELFKRVREAGSCLVSEYSPGMLPRRWFFPQRNRLVAALSDALIVVQAGGSSGALITDSWAGRMGVPRFAVPGDAWYEASFGAARVLREGGRMLCSPADLACVPGLESLRNAPWPRPGVRPWGHGTPWDTATGAPAPRMRSPEAAAILRSLGQGPLPVEELLARTGLPSGRLQAVLLDLEIEGCANRLPGGIWIRNAGASDT